MRRISDPDFVYRPWSAARREAASKAAAIRFYGSEAKARQARTRKLRALLARRAQLVVQLGRVRAHIHHLERLLTR